MRINKFCKVDKETDLTALEMYSQGISLTQISKELHIDRACLSKRLQTSGLKIRPNRTYDCNVNYFTNINTEHKAYWLGFIYADGCVTKRHTFEITLKKEDRYMLDILRYDIKSNAPITEKTVKLNGYVYDAVRLNVCRKQFADCLIQKGCVPNKSTVVRVPFQDIPEKLMSHFIRGYYDGNGCISVADIKHGLPTRNAVKISIGSGSKEMLYDLQMYLATNHDIHFSMVNRTDTYYEIQVFKMQEKDKFLHYIYDNATVFLGRKHNKYMLFAVMRYGPYKSHDN